MPARPVWAQKKNLGCDGAVWSVFGGVEEATVGEGVGRDVEDAHDDGSLAEREGAGAEAPVKAWTRGEGHGGILVREYVWC